MENEKTWDKDFNWFAEEHFDCHEMVAGSREAILNAFHEMILIQWPNRKFGTTLRNIRQEKGISLRKLAEKVNVSFVNISYIENGRIETSKSVLRSISKALDYDLDKLLSLANTVDDDIQNIINKRPASVPDFLRTAKNLTNEDWIELTKHVEKMKKKGK